MATRYIDPSGSNGTGTEASPYNAWSSVVLGAGDTIYFKRGTTHPSVTMALNQAGVTVDAYGDASLQKPIINVSAQTYGLLVTGLTTIKNVEVTGGTGTAAIAVSTGGGGSTIDGCTLSNCTATYGMWLVQYAIVNNCDITTAGANASVIAQHTTASTITNNRFSSTYATKSTTTLKGVVISAIVQGTRIEDNTFTGYHRAIDMSTSATNASNINRNTIYDNYEMGIYAYDCDNSFLLSNIINSGQQGINITNSDNTIIEKNNITNCTVQGVFMSSCNTCLVYDNDISDIWNGLLYPSQSGEGIRVSGTSTGNRVHKNRLTRAAKSIFDNCSAGGNKYIGNRVIDAQVNGIDIQSAGATPTEVHNNIVIHRPNGTSGHGIVFQVGGASSVAYFYNNMVYCDVDGSGGNIQAYCYAGTYAALRIDNNYCITSSPTINVMKLNASEYNGTQVAAYLAAAAAIVALTGQGGAGDPDVNSIFKTDNLVNDVFVGFANGDYRLKAGSLAIGTGYKWAGYLDRWDTTDQPLPIVNLDMGVQSTNASFHPRNL